jgi:nucleoside phosphorylase
MLPPMLMIAAALEEELETAKSLCNNLENISAEKTKLWRGALRNETVFFLRAGVGPRKSAERLSEALQVVQASKILLIGYGGALDPALKLGCIVGVGKATALRLNETLPGWEHCETEGEYELEPCPRVVEIAESAGLNACMGNTLTSPHVLGIPAHKQLLHAKFGAKVVDMETAALARVAQSRGIPLGCIRVISDEAADTFLAPFSYDPSARIPARARQLLGTGMVETYREWKTHSCIAKQCLSRFLAEQLSLTSSLEIRE